MSTRNTPPPSAHRIVPIATHTTAALPHAALSSDESMQTMSANGSRLDQLQRPLRDLRISVTDRCNFRCTYCMPREVFDKDYAFLPQSALLSFEEITRLARLFVAQGVEKIRLTGGEPLLRKHLERLIDMLAKLRTPQGKPLDLTLTTNGALLRQKAQSLKDAGLQRITVSLDALDDTLFKRMNDADYPVADVLAGIEAAQHVGLAPIKVNMVVQRGVNDSQILPMAQHFKGSGVVLRFIEFMDVGQTNGWQMQQVYPASELITLLQQHWPLTAMSATSPGETARRWRYADGTGEVGLIASVTQAFCGDCTRARLSTEGQLYLCLFAQQGYDLRKLLREEHSDAAISTAISQIWGSRHDQYSQLRGQPEFSPPTLPRIEMSYIGG